MGSTASSWAPNRRRFAPCRMTPSVTPKVAAFTKVRGSEKRYRQRSGYGSGVCPSPRARSKASSRTRPRRSSDAGSNGRRAVLVVAMRVSIVRGDDRRPPDTSRSRNRQTFRSDRRARDCARRNGRSSAAPASRGRARFRTSLLASSRRGHIPKENRHGNFIRWSGRSRHRRQHRHRRRSGFAAGAVRRQGRHHGSTRGAAARVGRAPPGDRLRRRGCLARQRRRAQHRRGAQASGAPRRPGQQRRRAGDRGPRRRFAGACSPHLGDERARSHRDHARGVADAAQVKGRRSSTWRRRSPTSRSPTCRCIARARRPFSPSRARGRRSWRPTASASTPSAPAPSRRRCSRAEKLGIGASALDQLGSSVLGMVPLRRFGKPEEVAQVIAFLASPASSYVSGAQYHVGGGMEA